jgi:UMF1 family MFS transporter
MGAVASMLFLFVVPRLYLLASLLVIIGVTCLGSSFVILNSFLPLLVANHPLAQDFSSGNKQGSPHIPMETLSPRHMNSSVADEDDTGAFDSIESKAHSKTSSLELQLSTKISSKGVGIGYCAAVFVQCISILVLYSVKRLSSGSSSQTLPLRLVLFLVGLCWFVFTIPSALWLRDRPGPPLSLSVPRQGIKPFSYLGYVSFAWISLWKTLKVAARLRQVVIFLIAWFLLSDAIATVSGESLRTLYIVIITMISVLGDAYHVVSARLRVLQFNFSYFIAYDHP